MRVGSWKHQTGSQTLQPTFKEHHLLSDDKERQKVSKHVGSPQTPKLLKRDSRGRGEAKRVTVTEPNVTAQALRKRQKRERHREREECAVWRW